MDFELDAGIRVGGKETNRDKKKALVGKDCDIRSGLMDDKEKLGFGFAQVYDLITKEHVDVVLKVPTNMEVVVPALIGSEMEEITLKDQSCEIAVKDHIETPILDKGKEVLDDKIEDNVLIVSQGDTSEQEWISVWIPLRHNIWR
ncbi:hypothetical protein ACFE04_009653 [Oxalis oulophora]